MKQLCKTRVRCAVQAGGQQRRGAGRAGARAGAGTRVGGRRGGGGAGGAGGRRAAAAAAARRHRARRRRRAPPAAPVPAGACPLRPSHL